MHTPGLLSLPVFPPMDENFHDTAMEEEMHALAENETWDLVDAPKGVKPIGCRWVNRYKARLVAKGYA